MFFVIQIVLALTLQATLITLFWLAFFTTVLATTFN